MSKGWGQFPCFLSFRVSYSHTYTFRASSTVLPRGGAGITLLSAVAIQGQGQMFHLPQAASGGRHLFLTHATLSKIMVGTDLPFLHSQGRFNSTLIKRVSSTGLPRQDTGHTFLNAIVSKQQCHLPCLPQMAGTREGSLFLFPSPPHGR